ncbi:MAG: protein kinase domain-containing protein [Planctomycetota bacterium]
MFVLKVREGPDAGKQLELQPGQTYTVGCDEGASLVLSDPMVLKGHCSLEVGEGVFILRNHTASAGTYVQDRKVSQAKLGLNTSFRVGDTVLTLSGGAPARRKRAGGPDPLLGKIIGGYKLNEVVGEGGMGKVYRATQLSLHRDVAVKVLRDALAQDEAFRDQFINEARSAAQLVHPNVVQVYDGGSEGSITFFSMEFIGQGSVEENLARDGKIAWEEAILMVLEAAHGLEYAEKKQIVHRDIKPDNLMINDDGRVKIADLGLAKRGEGARRKGIIGTAHFIPPEQALGQEVDQRADIYSLGATFFRMITGKTLFSGQTAKEIVIKHIKEPPPAASAIEGSVPDDLDLVFAKMLAKDPGDRYQTARELIASLEEVCARHGIKGAIIRRGVGKKVLIPLVVVVVAAIGVAIHFSMQDPVEVESPEARAARLEAEAEAKRQAEERRKAEKNTRRSQAALRWQQRITDYSNLQRTNPIESVYDDIEKAAAREMTWTDLADRYEELADHALAKEFEQESQYRTRARQEAAQIREKLRKLEESATDKREKIKLMVQKARDIAKAQENLLGGLRVKRNYEQAANLCALISTKQPRKEEPFREIVEWEWVSPVDSSVRQPATLIEEIMKIVRETRRDFGKERPKILKEATLVATQALEAAQGLGESSRDEAYLEVIEDLDRLMKSFVDEQGTKPVREVRKNVDAMRKKRNALSSHLEDRRNKRLVADRQLVRNKQRLICSLDLEQLPNRVMECDFKGAIDEWNKLLENQEIQTQLYRSFVRERVQMLRYCEYLFAAFKSDLNAGKMASLDLGELRFPGKVLKGVELDKAQKGSRYEITLTKAYERKKTLRLARFPMDWVYHRLFLHENEVRWAEPGPVIHFALGAFCFETMQYKAAKRHFEAVLKIDDEQKAERYVPAARALLERAEREQAARQEWEEICRNVEQAESTQALKELKSQVLSYPKRHEGTMFFLEVMGRRDAITRDFYDPAWPEIPKAPPPPEE